MRDDDATATRGPSLRRLRELNQRRIERERDQLALAPLDDDDQEDDDE